MPLTSLDHALVEAAIPLALLDEAAAEGSLWAVLDLCDAPAALAKFVELGDARAIPLYRGTPQEPLWDIGPCLVRANGDLLAWIQEVMWLEPWGVLLVAHGEADTLAAHLRSLLVVDAPNGEQWNFRYYDPRVLPTYLRTCTQAELDEFFGPVRKYVTSVGPEDVRSFARIAPSA